MNFFEQQARARQQSRWLLLAFVASVLAVAGLIGLLSVVTLVLAAGSELSELPLLATLAARWQVLVLAALAVLLVIGLASLYKVAHLRGGGAVVARELGASEVPAGTSDAAQRRLRNVVEEVAIASGVPVPQIFVLEREQGINAFAAGFTPADAAISVTRGALEKLSRDELQGVVAHEFSHVLNGDMRLNIRLMGMVFGLLVIHIIGREILWRMPRGHRRDGGSFTLLAFGLMALGLLGMFFARLIKARISRQREFLADASAVQFTRQTDGLAGALKKLAGLDAGSRFQQTPAEEVSHMLFGEGLSQAALFTTHPPLIERIRRLQPAFSITEVQRNAAQWNTPGYRAAEEPAQGLSAFAASDSAAALAPASVVAKVAQPGSDDYRHAEWLSGQIPENLRQQAEDTATAPGLLLALLMTDAPAAAAPTQSQLASMTRSQGPACAATVRSLLPSLTLLPRSLRLPLASLAFASLRQRADAELRPLQDLITELTLADGQTGFFEFALGHLLRVQLDDWLQPAATRPAGRLRLDDCPAQAAQLLALLAEAGTTDAAAARAAAAKGWAHLYGTKPQPAAGPLSYASLEPALRTLDGLVPFAKQALIEAMVQVLAFDGRTSIGEAELLRVVCASLHCPLPPLLSGGH